MRALLITATVAATPMAAGAATFDFGALGTTFADANGFEGTWEQVTGGTWTVDGIGVTATTNSNNVHTDSDWRLGPDSGIGPCGIEDCNASDEDGFGPGETITLTFSQPVTMTSLLLRQSDPGRGSGDPDHTPAQGQFSLNDATRTVVDGAVAGSFGSGAAWEFGYVNSDYYINTAVVELLSGIEEPGTGGPSTGEPPMTGGPGGPGTPSRLGASADERPAPGADPGACRRAPAGRRARRPRRAPPPLVTGQGRGSDPALSGGTAS